MVAVQPLGVKAMVSPGYSHPFTSEKERHLPTMCLWKGRVTYLGT